MSNLYMKDKNKVTLYIPPELHRQLKIQSAVDSEPMSAIAERALTLYLEHSEALHCLDQGHAHQIHSCPRCSADFILRDGEAIAVSGSTSAPTVADSVHVLDDDAICSSQAGPSEDSSTEVCEPEKLVTC
ncbi:MAG: hypothetical protein AAF289_10940 [Cyanobacteria bacterium P01_A01_bin.135]